jgi:MFS family permease
MSTSGQSSNLSMSKDIMANGILGRTGVSVIAGIIAACVAVKYRNEYDALKKPSWGLSFVAFVVLGIIALVVFISVWQRVWLSAVNKVWVDFLFSTILLVSLAWVITFFSPEVDKSTSAYLSVLLLVLSFGGLWMCWSWDYRNTNGVWGSILAVVLFLWTLYLTVYSFSFTRKGGNKGDDRRENDRHGAGGHAGGHAHGGRNN